MSKSAIRLNTYRAKTTTAQRFADQSPLGTSKQPEPEPNQPEPCGDVQTSEKSSDETTQNTLDQPTDESIEMIDNATKAGANEYAAVSEIRRSAANVSRAHSWDPSQGSEYEYSEEEASNELTVDKTQQKDIHEVFIDLVDSDTDDNDLEGDAIDDRIQQEDPRGKVHHSKRNRKLEIFELKDLGSPNSTEPVNKNQDSLDTNESGRSDISREHGRSSTPLEPTEVLSHKKRKSFGLFGASVGSNTEPVVESVYTKPPPRLRDLVKKRQRERQHTSVPEKRTKYNLRPRRKPVQDLDEGSLCITRKANDLDTEIETEDEEPKQPHRTTMSVKVHQRKPIPRGKAARKTAWSSMGKHPKDGPHGAESNRQIVQVVIPVIDKSGWEPKPTRKSSTAADEAQSPEA